MLRAFRRSMKRRGGRNASGEGPTLASSLYLDGGLDRGCSTCVCCPCGRLADFLQSRHKKSEEHTYDRDRHKLSQ